MFRLSFQRFFFLRFRFVRSFSVRKFAVLGVNSLPYRVISTGILKLALGSYPIAGSQVFPFLEEVRMGGGKRGNIVNVDRKVLHKWTARNLLLEVCRCHNSPSLGMKPITRH